MIESNELLEEPCIATKVLNSVETSIAELCARGRTQYARKNYEQAADLYSRATELQAELNGELNPGNAEILFLYGRSLFKLGQSKSDVLGGRKGCEKKKQQPSGNVTATDKVKDINCQSVSNTEKDSATASTHNDAAKALKPDLVSDKKKPLFQFTGDENFEESEEEDKGQDEEEDEEEDELAAAFDVLDLAKVLFKKKLEEPDDTNGKQKSDENSQMTNHYKERLADTHDLLAEISLENERFPAAVSDCRAALAYKQELYTEERSIIAEAHFKLSLALEFASITSAADEKNETTNGAIEMDQNMRNEAIKEMEAAIKSTNLKLKAKELELKSSNSTDNIETTRGQIIEVKEMLAELQNRLEELKGPAIDVKSALFGPLTGKGGILGAGALGESPSEAAARVEDAKKTATDVTGLVRKKAKVTDANGVRGKRKADYEEKVESKKLKAETVENNSDDIAEMAVE